MCYCGQACSLQAVNTPQLSMEPYVPVVCVIWVLSSKLNRQNCIRRDDVNPAKTGQRVEKRYKLYRFYIRYAENNTHNHIRFADVFLTSSRDSVAGGWLIITI